MTYRAFVNFVNCLDKMGATRFGVGMGMLPRRVEGMADTILQMLHSTTMKCMAMPR